MQQVQVGKVLLARASEEGLGRTSTGLCEDGEMIVVVAAGLCVYFFPSWARTILFSALLFPVAQVICIWNIYVYFVLRMLSLCSIVTMVFGGRI